MPTTNMSKSKEFYDKSAAETSAQVTSGLLSGPPNQLEDYAHSNCALIPGADFRVARNIFGPGHIFWLYLFTDTVVHILGSKVTVHDILMCGRLDP